MVPFRVLNRKNVTEDELKHMLFKNWYFLGVKDIIIKPHPQNIDYE